MIMTRVRIEVEVVMSSTCLHQWNFRRVLTRPRGQPGDGALQHENHDKCKKKDDPARKLVEEAIRRFRSDPVRGHARTSHARAVGENRHRDGGSHDQRPNPSARIHEIPVDQSQRDQRHERSDSAARLRDFERRVREHEQVAFAQDGNADR